MDAANISMQHTYFKAHTPHFCLAADDTTSQPSISGWMPPYSVCNRVLTQPTNLLYQDGCQHIQYATYLL